MPALDLDRGLDHAPSGRVLLERPHRVHLLVLEAFLARLDSGLVDPREINIELPHHAIDAAVILELLLVTLVIFMTFVNTYLRDWSGHLMDGKQTLQYDREAYINPFYRAIPYLVGFITAQIWHEKSRICPNLGLRRCVSYCDTTKNCKAFYLLCTGE